MPPIPAEESSDDALAKSAFGALVLLKDNLVTSGYTLSIEDEDRLVTAALTRHAGHLLAIDIQQDHLDPFKLLCWLGAVLIENLEEKGPDAEGQQRAIIGGLIGTLEEVLFLETDENIILSEQDKELLKRLLMEELKNNCDFGIGFNGLYTAFHFARATFKNLDSRNLVKKASTPAPVKALRAEKKYPT